MSRTLSKTNYNLVADAQKQAKELADKGRVFALFLKVHYSDVFPESDLTGDSKPKRKKSKKRAAAGDEAPAGQVEKATNTRTGLAPSWLPREILEVIMRQLGSLTIADVLEERQRGLHVAKAAEFGRLHEERDRLAFLEGPLRLKGAFPDLGEHDMGYRWHEQTSYRAFEGLLKLEMRQHLPGNGSEVHVTWKVDVDLAQVPVNEAKAYIEFPEQAISVKTDAPDMINAAKLTRARVEEMLRFRLRGVMHKSGDVDFLQVVHADNATGLRFQVKTGSSYLTGMVLDSHAGLAVGDRVRIEKPYKAYEHFARGKEGVIRGISLQTFVTYYVELGDENSEISKQVVRAHARGRGAFQNQPDHTVECQRFQLEKCD
jgi:hypothetical protein